MKRHLVAAVTAALVSAASAAHAQQAPPPPPAPPPTQAAPAEDEAEDDIVVVAEQGDQVRIDRRTYTLRDDAEAQSTNMFDVLGRIPSVSVAPSGAVTLLGASNVTIQINGQPVPGANLEQILRGLPGGDVERIEVITNPSAQYSAQSSGGIINILTRQRFNSGFSGSLQASADSLGGYHFGLAPNWSRGPWSLSGQVGLHHGEQESELTREREDTLSGEVTTEDGDRQFSYEGWYANRLQIGYRPDEKRRMSLAFDTGQFDFDQQLTSQLSDAFGPVSTRSSRMANSNEQNQLVFDFQQEGDQPRELLKFNAALGQFANGSNNLYTNTPAGAGAVSQYLVRSAQDTQNLSIELDVEQPFAEARFLTYGAAFDSSDQDIENALETLIGAGPPDYDTALQGTEQTLAAYVTYQFGIGDWTFLPGLRAEHYRREVISAGLETDDDDLRAFPSLHLRRALTSDINIDLSYASRIQRPGFQQLNPAVRFFDVDRASSGNPNLEPTTTDAYEANFVYQDDGTSFSVTFFDRISEDVVSQFTEVTGDGVIFSMPINAGTSEQRGLQVLARGPIGGGWRYSLSGNVLNREFDALNGGVISRRSEMEYDGVAQLAYRDSDQNAVGADQLQFELRFQGPRYGLQSESDALVTGNVTWRRKLTPRLSAVATVQDVFDSANQVSEIRTEDYFERTEFSSAGTRLRLALTYQLGDGPQRPPQDQPSGPPMPMQ